MMVGDYLFVSKVSYGPKLPNTPLSIPFTHHHFAFDGLIRKRIRMRFNGPTSVLPEFPRLSVMISWYSISRAGIRFLSGMKIPIIIAK